MNKKIIPTFLFLITLALPYSASPQEKFSNTQLDSLRKELNNKKGDDKIAKQLDFALLIMDNDQYEAKILANSALTAARKRNIKNLEMRSYFTLGRINEGLGNKDFSEAYYDTALTIMASSVELA